MYHDYDNKYKSAFTCVTHLKSRNLTLYAALLSQCTNCAQTLSSAVYTKNHEKDFIVVNASCSCKADISRQNQARVNMVVFLTPYDKLFV